MLGTQMHVAFRFYISAERYGELSEQLPQNGLTLLSARLHNAEDTVFFQTDHDKEVSPDGLLWSMSRDSVKQARTMIPTLIAVIITVFAIILLIVSLIVIRFRIVNGIEESMANIGVLKSAGYRSVQIVASNILQYGLVALAPKLRSSLRNSPLAVYS